MTALTRRRDPNSREEAWLIFYDGDIHAGTIGRRSGNPVGNAAWDWRCGFYPGSEPGEGRSGTAEDFESARAAFEAAWRVFIARRTAADFEEYRRHRAALAWKYAMWDAGCRLPTQMADGRSRCFCGAEIDVTNTSAHIYAAHMEPKAA